MSPETDASQAIHLLASINRLGLKAFNADTKQALTFLMLNDTLKVVKYQRAGLWKVSGRTAELLGISGYSVFNDQTPFVRTWGDLVAKIEDPKKAQIVPVKQAIPDQNQPQNLNQPPPNVLWMPITVSGSTVVGLWLERGYKQPWKDDEIEILNFLMQNYGASWNKFSRINFGKIKFNKPLIYSVAAIIALLVIIRIPIPIAAPCEVVPQFPISITAPLDGIIDHIAVQPGQQVKKGEILLEYDKRVPLQELKVAEDQVKIIQSELKRANSLAFKDKKALEQVGISKEKLRREKAQESLARYKVEQLDIKSPIDGVVVLENADLWRGNPVHMGENIMMVSDPAKTKLKIWIPESDNVALKQQSTVKVILNVMPENSYYATLSYIGDYTTENEKQMPSFLAEAEWQQAPEHAMPGLKGTAILYGEKVSLMYWIVRRPWIYLRSVLGL